MQWEIKAFDQLSLQELYTILTLRTNVFVVEQACPYPELDGKDPNCLHLLGTINGELVAYLRILPAGLRYDEVSIGRVVVKPSHRGKGLGRLMMEQAIHCITNEWKESQIKIGAQAYLEKFYQSLGFEPVSEVYLEDDIPHLDMLYSKPVV
ncbi:GNAT family N-acetyltransferase [Streptococcus parasuis]|uniref:GNAT family N-acetyltransferase n=1 Tax=Streptococcus parasuis TaxID=1501662 RepID=UPI001C2CAE2E|nr:GNAT family N-acetyltransferase [Streptococcus parasuis]MDG3146746.1 GNAT family N-acetyltransferase [Streptococcus suis]MBV1944526.1 GNAT family N-acetyltransferase [Streptococcus parasuis]MDG3214176.1 GNAT family N-acetyltransferase [Streptococcus suis]QXF05473.1 GNAT family N-acetyltransferase [Streptococcus parasuis]WJQ84980.1 GNAT family N-acetyltransferase [Streptococcus parasuis]